MNEHTAELTDAELLERISSVLTAERAGLARLIQYLAEVEERRLHLTAAHSSMFDFCTKRLRLSEGEAFRRLTAARLARRFPAIVELLETGSIHLTALVRLRDHLTDENHAELLREAGGKTKQELEHLLACRAPKPDAPSKIRKLPAPRKRATASEALALGQIPPESPRPSAPASAPLSPHRFKIQFTADEALKDKLERALDLLSHSNPGRDLAAVVERAVDLLLADLEKKKLGKAKRPRAAAKGRPGAISRQARREVFARDGERCSYVSEEGRRCDARAFTEVDHVEPRARGGSGESENLRVVCRAHNRLAAEQAFGREHVEQQIHFRQKKRRDQDDRYEKLFGALTGLGFKPKPTRAVLDRMRSGGGSVGWDAPLDQLLREATQLLTPGFS